MRKTALAVAFAFLSLAMAAQQQRQPAPATFVADTLVVGAEGQYETDPDLATLTFQVTAQEKELKAAYQKAGDAIRKIVTVAEKNGLDKESIQTGALSLTPMFDSKRRARSYLVQGQIVLKLRDFTKIGPIMDDSVQEGIIDFRSLTYSLADEEAAKQRAVAEAMRRAVARATIALEQSKQKLGPVKYVNLDVTRIAGIQQVATTSIPITAYETVDLSAGGYETSRAYAPPPPPPMPLIKAEKITIRAVAQCVFQIQ